MLRSIRRWKFWPPHTQPFSRQWNSYHDCMEVTHQWQSNVSDKRLLYLLLQFPHTRRTSTYLTLSTIPANHHFASYSSYWWQVAQSVLRLNGRRVSIYGPPLSIPKASSLQNPFHGWHVPFSKLEYVSGGSSGFSGDWEHRGSGRDRGGRILVVVNAEFRVAVVKGAYWYYSLGLTVSHRPFWIRIVVPLKRWLDTLYIPLVNVSSELCFSAVFLAALWCSGTLWTSVVSHFVRYAKRQLT